MPKDVFGERLNRLFDTVHPPDRGPFTNQEVADRLRERGGTTVSHVTLWQLRTGRRDNPTRRTLEALASFFGVPVAYFFDAETAAKVDEELSFVQQLRDNGVKHVATRVAGLSADSMQQVIAIIERLRQREQLTDDTAPPERDECVP